jgi:hypothetical protein
MNYEELKKLAIMLYGKNWSVSLRCDLELKQHTLNNWRVQGVPDWVFHEMASVVNKRAKEIDEAVKFFNGMGDR